MNFSSFVCKSFNVFKYFNLIPFILFDINHLFIYTEVVLNIAKSITFIITHILPDIAIQF